MILFTDSMPPPLPPTDKQHKTPLTSMESLSIVCSVTWWLQLRRTGRVREEQSEPPLIRSVKLRLRGYGKPVDALEQSQRLLQHGALLETKPPSHQPPDPNLPLLPPQHVSPPGGETGDSGEILACF